MAAYVDVEQRVTGEARVARRRLRFLARDSYVAYAFIAPAFFLLAVLVAYPFVLSVWFSLSDARVGNTGSFVGLSNFRRLLSSSIFLQTLQNTIVFTAAACVRACATAPGRARCRRSAAPSASRTGSSPGTWTDTCALVHARRT